MNITTFLVLLFAFSIITSLITEAIKHIVSDKNNLPYNIIALVVALIVGIVGTIFYYQLNTIDFNTNNVIFIILMGIASGITSMVGYDKVKQAIMQIVCKYDTDNKTEKNQ